MAKESLYGIGNHLIFRETFNDVGAIVNNNGVATDLTFRDGRGIFNGNTSNILYQKLINIFKVHSIRLKFKSYDLTGYNTFFGKSNTTNLALRINKTVNQVQYRINGTTYAASPNVVENKNYEIIITRDGADLIFYKDGISFGTTTILAADNIDFIFDLIGERGQLFDLEFDGEMELIEVYDKVLTADEVLSLSKNEYYKKINKPLIYSLSPINGYLASYGEDIDTVTEVTLERKGQVYVSRCDENTSEVILANTINLGTKLSFFIWVNLKYIGTYHVFAGGDGQSYLLTYNDLSKSIAIHNGVTSAQFQLPNFLDVIGNWGLIGVTRNDTDCKFYFNGEYLDNKALGTNDIQTLNIAYNYGGSLNVRGDLGEMFVYDQVLTDLEVSQLYVDTKFKYIG